MRAALVLALCFSASALADWQTLTLPGVPVHATAKGVDHFAVTTDQGVYELVDGGVARQLPVAGLVVGFIDGSGCLGGGALGGVLTALDGGAGTCAYGYNVFQGAPGVSLGALAFTGASTAYAVGNGVSPELRYTPSTVTPTPPWTKMVPATLTSPGRLSVLRSGGADWALVTGTSSGVPTLLLTTGTTVAAQYRTDAGIGEVQLFEPIPGGIEALVAPPAGGLQRLALDAGLYAPISWATLPGSAPVRTVSFIGSPDGGETFGLLVQGTGTLAGAVPDSDPTRMARTWVAFTQPSGVASIAQVRCFGARTCVAISDAATSPNVAIYRNAAPPNAPASSAMSLDEAQSVFLTATATDPDGDPVLIQWGTDPALTVTPQPDGKSALVAADRGRLSYCGPAQVAHPLTVVARDGWPAHVSAPGTVTVTVRHVIPPDPPALSVASFTATAGDAPVMVTASPAATTGVSSCPPNSFTATLEPGGQAGVTVQGTNPFTVGFPTAHCSLDAGVARVLVRAVDSAGASDAGVVDVTVRPWGLPDSPFPAGARVTQLAGSTVSHAPQATHVCATANGFPGVVTEWTLASGGGLPGVSVTVGGAALGTAPLAGASASVASTDSCTAGEVALSAVNALGAQRSAPGTLRVILQPNPRPLADAGFTLDAGFSAGQISGATALPGVDCLSSRGLAVDVEVSRAGTPIKSASGLPLGGFSLPDVPLDCTGDAVDVAATLTTDGGTTGKVARATVVTPRQSAGLSGLSSSPLLARCGEPARGLVHLAPGPLECTSAELSLQPSSDAGVAVTVARIDGGLFSVETVDTGLSEVLGQQVTLRAVADGGTGNGAAQELSLGFTAEPFVALRHEAQWALARSPEPQTVTVALTNLSTCAVEGVTLREPLKGHAWVPGSARVDGVAREAQEEGGTLVVSGLSLPAAGSVRFSYSTRLKPFGKPVWAAEAYAGGVKVSLDEPGAAAPATGCGCGMTGAPGATALLCVLLLRARRRSRRAV